MSTLESFVLAMMAYPEIQRTAQQEIDGITDRKRLPDFADRESLPYLNALFLELLRWSSVVPLGLPHMVTQDDEYCSSKFKKGTTVIPNTWACMHDGEDFPEPNVFRPERFIVQSPTDRERKSPPDPRTYVFGYGRRVCPGKHLAESVVWIAIAYMLATLDLSTDADMSRLTSHPDEYFQSTVVARQPKAFPCHVTVRSPTLFAD